MNIGSIKGTKDLVENYNFNIKKKFGQNFLIDKNILSKIVETANIKENTCIIEVGPGLGGLTELLSEKAKKVLAYEIDKDLFPILNSNFKDKDNVKIINQDILKVDIDKDINEYLNDSEDIIVVANLPYYITTPILMKFLETTSKVKRLIVMMQYEVASRICSKPNTKDYNSLSIAIQYKCDAKISFKVPKNVFIPIPKVDSAVVLLDVIEKRSNKPINEEFFFQLVRNSFAQRRKTLVNNLSSKYSWDKEFIIETLKYNGIAVNIRAEGLDLNDFIKLSDYLYKKNKV